MKEPPVLVGIGEYAVSAGEKKLTTVGLGSCVGIVIFDKNQKISGLSHIMLPTMGAKQDRIGKYADTAIPKMLEDMLKKGANKMLLRAKIAGGASVFSFKEDNLKIGDRNIRAVKEILKNYNIRILSEDVGGNRGRTIIFDPITTDLFIRMVKKGPDEPSNKVI
jgi:chemotaxis protein CheD